MPNGDKKPPLELSQVNEAIQLACDRSFGVLDSGFMCQSISIVNPPAPLCVGEDTSVSDVLAILRRERVGCVLVTDQSGKLVGIFSERDCILKVTENFTAVIKEPVSAIMTRDPVTQTPDATIAFALNLMSQGGFRHIPIVDSEGVPTGLISVKDVVDYMVGRFVDDILSLDLTALANPAKL